MTTRSYRAGAFLEAAGRLGVPVTVASERGQALAWANPDGHLTLDFGAVRPSVEAIEAFAKRRPLGAVLSADDDGVELAAEAARSLGLPQHTPEAVAATRNKLRMRERFAAAGLPTPRFEGVTSGEDVAALARRAPYPCVVKPLSLGASRGVIRADDPTALERAVARVSALLSHEGGGARPSEPAGLLVEEYVPGAEVALEGLVTAGRLRTLALFDKPDPLEGPFFEETLYVTPSRLPAGQRREVEERAAGMVAALGLSHGPVHAELRINDHGVWPIEIAARSIGGLCSRALRFEGGIPLEELILRHALGLPGEGLDLAPGASGVLMIPIPKAGTLRGVRGAEAARGIPDVEDLVVSIAVGERVVPLPEGARYLGFLFARAPSPERVEAALRSAHRLLTFDIEPTGESPRETGAR